MTRMGASIVGGASYPESVGGYSTVSRIDGSTLEGVTQLAPKSAIDAAAKLAVAAFHPYRDLAPERRTQFLELIAEKLEANREAIVDRAHHESALPLPRLNGELGRTTGQLKMFAAIVRDDAWADVRIDEALPDRQPLPRPDLRSMMRPLGPVAIFGASNFPLAFSTMGGDAASALAAGCPIIVKGHPAHPGTAELVAWAVVEAIEELGLPEGVFSLLFGEGTEFGRALVEHPAIQAVGFTGSRQGGLALLAAANARPVPIPVYAEMSSVNPSVVLPGKLADATAFAAALAGSVTLGVGQFCTNPGLIFTVGDEGYAAFEDAFVTALKAIPAGTMLTDGIAEHYVAGCHATARVAGVRALIPDIAPGAPAAFVTDAKTFIANPKLEAEVFGPSTLIVRCADVEEALTAISGVEGQLTGSIHASPTDFESAKLVADALEAKVGRLIFNQFPTGVEVCSSMVHGGPYPATSDSRTTSVGGRAISRWVRPVCFQGFPVELLPNALKLP